MTEENAQNAIGDYKFGFHDPETATIRFDSGLSEKVVRDISELKGEPEWMTEIRLKAFHRFEQMPMPKWGSDILEQIDFDAIIYFLRSIILPFYRLMRPIMQKFGTWLGLGAASNLKSNTDGIGAILAGDWEEVARLTKEGNEKILKSLEDAGKAWDTWILSLDLPAWGTIETTIEAWITDLGIKLPTWAGIKTEVETWITDLGIKLPTWAGIKTKIEAWITDMGIALPSWEDITSTIDSITSGVLGLAQALRDFIIDLATSFGIDLGWSDTPSPPPPPLPPTNGTENNNTNADIYPWLETPESRFSDSGKGGGR